MNTQTDATTVAASTPSNDLQLQSRYAESISLADFDFSLMIADAFVRGIRDLGYKHTGTALDELVDNSIQSEATEVHVAFGYESTSDKKPVRLAVIDNGHGMVPAMLRLSVIWGGTHRQDDRTGFGRYGYGLPSASVSQGRAFNVYSCIDGGTWNKVRIDLDDIADGKYTARNGHIVVPEPKATQTACMDPRIRARAPRSG